MNQQVFSFCHLKRAMSKHSFTDRWDRFSHRAGPPALDTHAAPPARGPHAARRLCCTPPPRPPAPPHRTASQGLTASPWHGPYATPSRLPLRHPHLHRLPLVGALTEPPPPPLLTGTTFLFFRREENGARGHKDGNRNLAGAFRVEGAGAGRSSVEASLRDDRKNHGPWIELKPLMEDCEPLIFNVIVFLGTNCVVRYTKVKLSQWRT